MIRILKNNYKFIFIFFFFLSFNLVISPLNMDEIWSYGFSNNLYNGLVPYKDFNMVITLFQPFLYSLPMYLFGNNILVFHLFHTVIITLFFIILDKLIGKKMWLIFPLLIFPLNISFPNYNFLLLFLFVLVIYMEKNNYNDYLIGIVLGLIFLTKQSILLILVSLYYIKNKDRKLLKRFIGFMGPCLIFLIYLLVTGSFNYFIDLCILGLFDFSGNFKISIPFIFTIIFLIILILYLTRDYKNIYIYYSIMFISICIPLFDYYHFLIFFISFLIFIFINDFIKIKYYFIGIIFGVIFYIYSFTSIGFSFNNYPNKINNFNYRYINSYYIKYTYSTLDLIDKYNNYIIIGIDGYYYKIINDERVNYFDLLNKGNFGYNGTDKLIKRVSELDDYYFFISKGNLSQTDKELIKYIKDNYELIDENEYYYIYY